MAGQDEDLIYSDDFTRVIVYQSRQFTLGDLSQAAINGLQWDALPAALRAAGQTRGRAVRHHALCGSGHTGPAEYGCLVGGILNAWDSLQQAATPFNR